LGVVPAVGLKRRALNGSDPLKAMSSQLRLRHCDVPQQFQSKHEHLVSSKLQRANGECLGAKNR
jgi:hypothetical protein